MGAIYINQTKFLIKMIKRGLSHIEFIISFVIFIGFILFAFVFFNPLQSERTLKSSMDYAWIEVARETQEKIEFYSVSINSSVLEDKVAIKISGIPSGYNSSVEDVDGNFVESYFDQDGVNFDRRGKNFFRIKYSPIFQNGQNVIAGSKLNGNEYYISSSNSEKIYFEKLFLELNKSYFSDYSSLKKKINLPNRVDFGFVVKFKDYEIVALKEIPEGLEVLSKSDRIEVIRNQNLREYAEVRVLVW